jgi:hypothetical protein
MTPRVGRRAALDELWAEDGVFYDPGEFVPYILCWAGVALSWLAAHKARNNAAVATAITNNHRSCLIGVISAAVSSECEPF